MPPTSPDRAKNGGRVVQMRLAECIDDAGGIADMALESARAGAKVLVIRNSVRGAIDAFDAIAARERATESLLLRVNDTPALHHGRFAREDRVLLDAAVERAIGRTRPAGGLVAVGTQTLEQSLDIDADVLITDLCPADVLLQRLGRLHRHQNEHNGAPRERPAGFRAPLAAVLVPADGLRPYLAHRLGQRNRHGLGFSEIANQLVGTYPDLVALEATRRLIAARPVWRIPAMNRELVERATHDQAIAELVDELVQAEGEAWRAHLMRLLGDEVARRQNAADSVLRRSRPFMEQPVRPDEHVTTRLGGDRRIVELPSGTVGAFGLIVTSIAVPGWMIRAPDRTADALVTPLSSDVGFILTIGSTRLRYDVRGLQRDIPET